MADDTAPVPAGLDQGTLNTIIQQLLANPPPVASRATPSTREGRGFLSLLGEGLGGGQQVGTTAEREQGGLSALGAMGARMLQASDYSYVPHSFGSILGQGLGAASENLGRSQAISSARLAAAQEEAHRQQQDKIARLKEALPYLTLQQNQAAVRAMPPTLTGGGAPGTGDGTYVGAIGGHEGTGKNPNSSAAGVGQFLDSTWSDFVKENPSYFAGMTPEQAMAARKNPEFGAKVGPVAIEWLAKKNAPALTGAGVTPSGQSLGIAHYLGAGAAAKVMAAPDNTPVSQFVGAAALAANPELRTMTVGQMKQRYAGTPAPTFLRGAAPATPPGQNPNASVTIPPPTQAAPSAARPTLPPPGPAMAPPEPGTAQTAGPGGPTGTIVPPSPPGSPGTVAAITQGMVAAGADPTTLAPGPGSRPGLAPGANVTAQLSPLPPGMDPNSREAYGILHPIVPPPEMRALFNPAPDPAQMAAIAARKQNAENEYQSARFSKDPIAAVAKARELLDKATADENTLRENAKKLGVETERGYYKDQQAARDAAWAAEQADRRKQADDQRAHERALVIKQAEGDQTRLTNQAQVHNDAARKLLEDSNTETVAARGRIGSLEAVLELSRNVQDPTLLATKTINGIPMVDLIKTFGIGSEAFQNKASAIQALRSGIANLTKSLRQGVALGNASDADLRFITAMGPSEMEDDSTREAILTNLLGQQYRQMRFNTELNKQVANGLKPGEAIDVADKLVPPTTPSLPKELQDAPRGDPRVAEWFQANVPPNTIWSDAKGKRHIFHAPGWTPPDGYRMQ